MFVWSKGPALKIIDCSMWSNYMRTVFSFIINCCTSCVSTIKRAMSSYHNASWSSWLTFLCFNFSWQFINHLVNQLARHQFLKIACQLEKKNMLGAYSLLKVIESEVQAYLSATKGRVVYINPSITFINYSLLSLRF